MKREVKNTRVGKTLAALGFVLLWGLFVLALTAWFWQRRNWDDIKLIEIYSQLLLSVKGTSDAIMNQFWLTCVLPAGLAMGLAALALVWASRRGRKLLGWGSLAAALGLVAVLVWAGVRLDLPGFFRNLHTGSTYIEDNYVDPAGVDLVFPEKKRNLIYIFLESMESTYADEAAGGAFDRNVIPELTALAEENQTFAGSAGGVNGGISTLGTTWTMGGLFAQTCGLPLKIPVTDNSMSYQERFFPGVTALGDILAANGYTQTLLIGSVGTFGGRSLYFRDHGDYAIWDYDFARNAGFIPQDYHVWWGYEDQKLFAFAKTRLTELGAGETPFNLTLLTADTHFPDGYVCPLCPEDWEDNQYSRVMACSSRQVLDFIDWVRAQPFYENTTIVLCGDHITMAVGYTDGIDPDYQRRTYTCVVNGAAEPADPDRDRSYTTMDLFPTTLAALGVEIPGDRLALGTNLYAAADTLVERDGLEEMDRQLALRSDLMDRLSGFNEEVFALSQALSSLEVSLEPLPTEEGVTVGIRGLSAFDDRFQAVEVFAEKMNGFTRTTLQERVCDLGEDGIYRADFDRSPFAGQESLVFNVYVTIPEGRIKVGTGWEYHPEDNSIAPWTGSGEG